MKNKKLIPLLLVVAAAVWGVVIRRVVSWADPVVPDTEPVRPAAVREPVGREYTLSLDYRDPFDAAPAPRKKVERRAAESPAAEPEPPPMPPPILFRGTIRQGGRSYALLDDGIFLRGDTLNGYTILAVSPDSVIVQQGKYRCTIKP